MTQLPDESLFGDYGEWPGRDVVDSGGERLGGVREIYLDRETGQPEWVLVDVDGGEARFVPLADAAVETSQIRVAHAATVIRDAPGIGSEPRIDENEERRLYAHYGLGYSDDESVSGLPTDDEPPPVPPAWGTPELREAAETETGSGTPETSAADADTTASWSDVAPSHTADSPPAAEPPSATEIDRADIPEPPAMTDRATEPEAADSYSTLGEPVSTDFDTHSPPDRSAYEPPAAFEATTTPEIAVPVTPDVIPSPPMPPEATAPEPVAPPPPSPASEAPRSTYTPPPAPEPEPSGGALAIIKSRPGGIAVGVVVAAVLLMIIRRLR
jgi:hypothetical protein